MKDQWITTQSSCLVYHNCVKEKANFDSVPASYRMWRVSSPSFRADKWNRKSVQNNDLDNEKQQKVFIDCLESVKEVQKSVVSNGQCSTGKPAIKVYEKLKEIL